MTERRNSLNKETNFDLVNQGNYGNNTQMSWRTVLAGFFVSAFSFAILLSLGFAVGGLSITTLEFNDLDGFSVGAGIWIVASAILSLFVGGYLTSRLSTSAESRIGAMQGLTTAGVFFFILSIQVGMGLGAISQVTQRMLGASWDASKVMLNQPVVQNTIDEALGEIRIEGPTDEFVQTLGMRLLQGRVDSAADYIAANSNLSVADARSRIQALESEFESAVTNARDQLGAVISGIGWTSFIMLLLGGLAGLFGGWFGAKSNFHHPILTRRSNIREDIRLAG